MRPFLYMVGEESPWLQPLWVFRAPPLRASDASPQRPAYSKKMFAFLYIYLMLSKILQILFIACSVVLSQSVETGEVEYDRVGVLKETKRFSASRNDSLALNVYISLTSEYLKEHNESWPIDSCDVYSIYETFKYKKTMLPLGGGRVFADDDFRVVRISSPKIGGYKILDNLEKNCPVIMKIIFDDSLSKGVIVVKDVFIYTRYIEKQEDGTWRLKKIRSGF